MLTKGIRNSFLVDELQLDQRLNNSLQASDRAEFALLLSMLSPDVTDSAQFADTKAKAPTDTDLRLQFSLPPAQKLYAQEQDRVYSEQLSSLFAQDGMRAVFLRHCLHPEPLVAREQLLSDAVLSSLSPLKQEKLRLEQQGVTLEHETVSEQGDGFEVLTEIEGSSLQISV